uniref:Protein kinase domain-containing protein n=1 Tax=Quercus lobata TaxID=97700 RepID=A0A7N2MD74_QUELO
MEALIGFFLHLFILGSVGSEIDFVHNGFLQANLSSDGASYVRSNGLLVITNDSTKVLGHAIYPSPLQFKQTKNNNKSTVLTFSTNFVFSIVPKHPDLGGHGLAFVLMSTKELNDCLPTQFLGLPYNNTTNQFSTPTLVVEFDTVQSSDFQDINDNHVGIDISNLVSNIFKPAAYYNTTSKNDKNTIFLRSGYPIQVWIDYNSQEMLINVSISWHAKGRLAFDIIPGTEKVVQRKGLELRITLASITTVILVIAGAFHVLNKIRNENEILEEWEIEYGAHRFRYSELFFATRGFAERNLIGSGGFGKVYRGVIPSTGLEVAINRVAQDSSQGMKEFVAEVTSMGRLRHRNLVQLYGWC